MVKREKKARRSSVKRRRNQVLSSLVEKYNSPTYAFDTITATICKLSVSVKGKLTYLPTFFVKIFQTKNRILFFLRGDDYRRVEQKFSTESITYARDKCEKIGMEAEVHGAMLTIFPCESN